MAIRLHVEDERVIPLSVSGGDSVEMKHSEAFINAISPTARVDQTEDGAVVTITDKNGTTTAEIHNGQPGSDADVTAENIEEALGYVPADERIKSAIFYGQCDPTSTAIKFTAQIDGITEYFDGLTILLKNGIVESKTGCTFNINGLGEKGAWGSYELSRISTAFTIARVYAFIYDSALDEGNGGFWLYQGKDTNDNTIGYLLRTNSTSLPVSSVTYRYRILFTSADKTHYVPANNSTSTNATAIRDVNQEKIDPFGKIVYYSSTTVLQAETRPSTTGHWLQTTIQLGYSFNRTGAALTLTPWKPVYVKATPYVDGSAIIDADEPITQDLPTTEDGKIYIHLANAYSATNVELSLNHPVYYYHNGGVQLWTGPSTHAELEQLYNAFPVDSASGAVASFADGADNLPLKSLVVGINPVQSGEGDPSPENIRPITGWTGANVARLGKNLLVDYWHTWNSSGQYAVADNAIASALIPVTPGEIFSCRKKVAFTGMNCNLMARRFDSNKNFIASTNVLRYNELQSTYVIPSNIYYVAFVQFVPQGTISPEQYDMYQVQVEKGDAVTEYETPANPYLYLITFPSEAGIVYGGSLDVLTGVLTVNRVKETFVFNNPTEDNTYNLESQSFTLSQRSTGASISADKITNVCGAYAYAQANWHDGEPHFYVGTTACILYLTKNTYRGGNVELCYPLETPLTYQLTPHEVKSLLGSNMFYADTGNTAVEYRADIQKYIDKKLGV